ncbi:hypothetical protein F5Y15DRAFT_425795 [Xylariaceae sp. FL0016]|nr:hypothetical protein F5Y15DRAFT_425795 [Xylariaceae sp. FL0016]
MNKPSAPDMGPPPWPSGPSLFGGPEPPADGSMLPWTEEGHPVSPTGSIDVSISLYLKPVRPPPSISPPCPLDHEKPPPSLLILPLEIRLEIYTHLLTLPPLPSPSPSSSSSSPSSTSISSSSSSSSATDPPRLHPSILRVSRGLHAEAHHILYTLNTFLSHPTLLTTFPSFYSPHLPSRRYAPVLYPSLAALITRFHVLLRLDAEPRFSRAAATAQFSGKAELTIECWQAMWRGSGPDALRLFEGVRGVRRACVRGSTGGFEEYTRWLESAMERPAGEPVKPFFWDNESDD